MSNEQIPLGDAFKEAWELFKAHAGLLLVITVASIMSAAVFENVTDALTENRAVAPLYDFATFVVWGIVSVGLITIALKLVRREKTDFADFFSKINRAPIYVISNVVTTIIIGVGLLLLVFPGIIFGVRTMFFGYVLLTEDVGPIDAIQRSWAMTEGHTVDLILFALLSLGVLILGLLCFGVGCFVAVPVVTMATARVFEDLRKPVSQGIAEG